MATPVQTSFPRRSKKSLTLKPLIDIVVSVFAGLVMLPLLALAALAVKLAPSPASCVAPAFEKRGDASALVASKFLSGRL